MPQNTDFCDTCGALINPKSGLCGSCGKLFREVINPLSPATVPTSQTPPLPSPYQQPPGYPLPPFHTPPYQTQVYATNPSAVPDAAASTSESLVGILPGLTRSKGFFKSKTFHAIVTNSRIIFAIQPPEKPGNDTPLGNKGGNAVSEKDFTIAAGYEAWKRYLSIAPEQSFLENPQNFAVQINQIRGIRFGTCETSLKKEDILTGEGEKREKSQPVRLEIETIDKSMAFNVTNYYRDEVSRVLRKAGLLP